jgi:hypothetical protein
VIEFFWLPLLITAPLLPLGILVHLWLRRRGATRPRAWIHQWPFNYQFWIPFGLALLAAGPAGVLSSIAYGIGHSSGPAPYFPKYLFPFGIMFSLPFDGSSLGLWCQIYFSGTQVVIYGFFLGMVWSRHSVRILGWLVVAHATATVLLFHFRPGSEL